jgi:hypothetical protein
MPASLNMMIIIFDGTTMTVSLLARAVASLTQRRST